MLTQAQARPSAAQLPSFYDVPGASGSFSGSFPCFLGGSALLRSSQSSPLGRNQSQQCDDGASGSAGSGGEEISVEALSGKSNLQLTSVMPHGQEAGGQLHASDCLSFAHCLWSTIHSSHCIRAHMTCGDEDARITQYSHSLAFRRIAKTNKQNDCLSFDSPSIGIGLCAITVPIASVPDR